MSTIYFIGLGVVGLLGFIHFKRFSSKFKAAMNALLAKYTFESLDTEIQEAIIVQKKIILMRDGLFRASNVESHMLEFTEKEKFGFYALAMSELGILPALSDYDWYYVRNPFVALLNADHEIKMAQRHFIKSEGIDIKI